MPSSQSRSRSRTARKSRSSSRTRAASHVFSAEQQWQTFGCPPKPYKNKIDSAHDKAKKTFTLWPYNIKFAKNDTCTVRTNGYIPKWAEIYIPNWAEKWATGKAAKNAFLHGFLEIVSADENYLTTIGVGLSMPGKKRFNLMMPDKTCIIILVQFI